MILPLPSSILYPLSAISPIPPIIPILPMHLTPFPDVMIDIEALADTPDSAPAQIALVFFDRDYAGPDPELSLRRYNFHPSPISAIKLGFSVTAATLLWWDAHNMRIDVQGGQHIAVILEDISTIFQRHRGPERPRVWSRGNSYDLAILKLAYQRTGKMVPWDFWRERDVRTWLEGFAYKSTRKNPHTALDDAVNQALDIIDASRGWHSIA